MPFYMPLYIKETMFSWDIFLRLVDTPSYFCLMRSQPISLSSPWREGRGPGGEEQISSYVPVIWSETVALPPHSQDSSGVWTIPTARSLLEWALSLLCPKAIRCGPCDKAPPRQPKVKREPDACTITRTMTKRGVSFGFLKLLFKFPKSGESIR